MCQQASNVTGDNYIQAAHVIKPGRQVTSPDPGDIDTDYMQSIAFAFFSQVRDICNVRK
jgi:hypothetical protein